MKKILALVFAVVFFASLASAASNSIGYVDVQKVFQDFSETSKAQKELSVKEESFKKEFEDSQKKLKDAEAKGKSKDDLEKLKTELEKKLEPKRKELLDLNQQLTGKLQLQILAAVKTVAKKVGLDLVLDKQVIITGGIDLTDMVVSELNK